MRRGQFQPGRDPRRNVDAGRPPSGSSIAATIRRTVGADAERICEQVRTLAAGGDPAAVVAAALLLGSVAAPVQVPAANAVNHGAISR